VEKLKAHSTQALAPLPYNFLQPAPSPLESHLVIDCFALLLETGEVFTMGLVKSLPRKRSCIDEYGGRVEDSGKQRGVTFSGKGKKRSLGSVKKSGLAIGVG
jgi:hypothetical protein